MAISNNSTGLRPGVCTSTTRPTAPYEGQMIFETDTDLVYLWSGSAWVEINSALTKAPRGVVSYQRYNSSGSISLPASTDTTLVTAPSFTAVANRVYKITWQEAEFRGGATGNILLKLKNNGTTFMIKTYSSAALYYAGFVTTTTTLAAGTTSITGVANPDSTGTTYRDASYVSTITVEDIGAG